MKAAKEAIWIHIDGRPIPKPRMTRADRWKQRPCVLRYRKYANDIIEAYMKKRLKIKKFDKQRPVSMGFRFYFAGDPTSDLDNIIKGIKDALKGYALEDDNVRIVQSYFQVDVMFVDCSSCPEALSKKGEMLKRPRCVILKCPKQMASVGFLEI